MKRELLIGAVAEACGVSADTIRHYERKGVLGGVVRDASGYRRYSPDAIERVRIVRRALAIGFTLDELARIFRQRASGQTPCRSVHRLAVRKLEELDARIEEMVAMREHLAETVKGWEARLTAAGESEEARLLESLSTPRHRSSAASRS